MSHRHPKRWLLLLGLLVAWALGGCALSVTPSPTTAAWPGGGATPSTTATAVPRLTRIVTTTGPTPTWTATARLAAAPTASNTPTASPTVAPSPTPTRHPPPPSPRVQGETLNLTLGWHLDANGHLTAGVVGTGDPPHLFLSSLGRTVYAADTGGNVIWHQKTPGPVYTLASVPGGGVAAGDDAGFVTLFDVGGQRPWRANLGTRVVAVVAAPVDVGGLFAGGWDERITRLDADGGVAWQADTGSPVSAIVVLPQPTDLVAVATVGGEVRAYDTKGQEVWRLDLGAPVVALGSLPAEAGPLLLAGVQDGRLVEIDTAGSAAWEMPLGSGAPVWQVAELSPGSWSILAGTVGAEPALVHLSATGDIHWSVSMPASVTAIEAQDLDGTTSTGSVDTIEIAIGLATGEMIVCDSEGRQRAAVHAGLPVWGLAATADGTLLVRADVAAWQIRAGAGPTGSPWLHVPSLASAGLEAVASSDDGAWEAVLLFLGDVSPGRSMEAQLLRLGPAYPWRGLAPLLPGAGSAQGDTLLVVNLEAVLTTRGEALSKAYLIRAHPMWGEMLAAGGVGLASLANNHALDYGPEGLNDTLATLETLGIATVGAGNSRDEAHRPARFTLNGVRVAVLAYAAARWDGSADVPHTDRIAWAKPAEIAADVRAVRPEVDLVVVLLHAGTEYATEPSPDQVTAAHAAVDAGAALVVGHHPHVTQTVERYKEGLIVYSLGDAIFDIPRQAAMGGHLLRVGIGRETDKVGYRVQNAELWPFWIDGAIQPRLLDDGADEIVRYAIYP